MLGLYALLAIPFFILAGYIMERSGIAARIVALMEALVGSMTGGLAVATVAVATFWGAVSGSGPATVAALGLILIPGMAKAGYDKAFAAATVSVTSGLAIVIPPSIAFIVYGSVADVSVPALFAAGFVPGIVVALFIMAAVLIISRKRGYRGQPSGKSVGTALKEAFWGVMTPVVILGGIYGGVFTPTEGGAFAAIYAIIVCMGYYRELSFRDLLRVSARAARTTAVVMLIVATATAVGWFITIAQIPNQVTDLFRPLIDSPVLLLLAINIFLLLVGMVMDLTPNILIFAPVFYPLITQAGIDPYFFGLLFILNLGIGVITPPVGTVLYVVCGVGNIKITKLVQGMLPFLVTEIIMLFLLLFFPSLSLTPLNWLMGG